MKKMSTTDDLLPKEAAGMPTAKRHRLTTVTGMRRAISHDTQYARSEAPLICFGVGQGGGGRHKINFK